MLAQLRLVNTEGNKTVCINQKTKKKYSFVSLLYYAQLLQLIVCSVGISTLSGAKERKAILFQT